MKFCILGAGAIGGYLAAKLSSHADVTLIARGTTLDAIRQRGLVIAENGATHTLPIEVASPDDTIEPPDVLIIAVKGYALHSIEPWLDRHRSSSTIVIPAMNGIPWWFMQPLPAYRNLELKSVDPGRSIANIIPIESSLGCVLHWSSFVTEPGVVHHKMGRGIILGEPLGGTSLRLQTLCELFANSGFQVTQSDNIRRDIWYKLWGNMTINPIAAVSGATADQILDEPLCVEWCTAVMHEAAAIGAKIDCYIDQSPQDRHNVTRKLGDFKPSMLQDVEMGKPIELESLVGVVHELGRVLNIPTPNTNALLGIMRLFARTNGLVPSRR